MSPTRQIALIVSLTLIGLITHSTYAGTGDEPHYLAIAHSIAFDGDLDLSNNYGRNEPLIAGGGLEPSGHVRPGRGGVVRPLHDVGMPALVAPYVRVAAPVSAALAGGLPPEVMRRLRLTPGTLYRHTLSLCMIVVTCVFAYQMLRVSESVTGDGTVSKWSAILVALSPPTMLLGVLFFTEVVSALLVLLVFRYIILEKDGSPWLWALTGVLLGLLFLVHARNVAPVLVLASLAIVRLVRERSGRSASAFLLALALMLAVRSWLLYTMWGAVVTTPHARLGEWMGWSAEIATASTRLAGLLIDQKFGLLPYAPVLLIAVLGAPALWRRSRAVCMAVALVVSAYLASLALPVINVHGWTGGWSPPGRFLMCLVPLLAPFLAAGLRSAPRVLVVGLVTIQAVISAYAWSHPKNFWNDADGVAAVCSRGGATFCSVLPSFVTAGDRAGQAP